MIKRITVLAASILLLAAPALASDEVTVAQLQAFPWNHADQEVQVVGELIGDYALQVTQVWIQINDDPYAMAPLEEAGPAGTNSGIGVLIHRSQFEYGWGPAGGYRIRGPIVRVTGIFRYNDRSESGGTYIEATRVELLEESRPIETPFSSVPMILGMAMLAAAGGYAVVRARNAD